MLLYTDAMRADEQISAEELIADRIRTVAADLSEERAQEIAGDLLMEILAAFRPDLVSRPTLDWRAWPLAEGLTVLRRSGLTPTAQLAVERVCYDMCFAEIIDDVLAEQRWAVNTRLLRTGSRGREHYAALRAACQAFLAAGVDSTGPTPQGEQSCSP